MEIDKKQWKFITFFIKILWIFSSGLVDILVSDVISVDLNNPI